ncbi:GNAT family N-acetyltransferase [Streptomyces avicenniae]|uniref:GNAT family N-acetyltransferase n=1 Tax=Streptomyces avicenniae TaxID=500153 RepID=UPI000DA61152|nr:GNAT family N-acetyltransferase [Streptomyces avicenniae]
MRTDVRLRPLDEGLLRLLLDAAVADAAPGEVMPEVAGPPGWTAERRSAFLGFHRSRALADEPVERTYAVVAGETVVGAARLCPVEGRADGAEAGVWIGRSRRGAGVGAAVLAGLLSEARAAGFTAVFVSTTPDNAAVLRLLASRGIAPTREGAAVTAWLPVPTKEGTAAAPGATGSGVGGGEGKMSKVTPDHG